MYESVYMSLLVRASIRAALGGVEKHASSISHENVPCVYVASLRGACVLSVRRHTRACAGTHVPVLSVETLFTPPSNYLPTVHPLHTRLGGAAPSA